MSSLYSARPSDELSGIVRAYAQRAMGPADGDLVQRVPASLEQVVEFEFGTPPTIEYWDGKSELPHSVSIVGAHSFPRASLRLGGGVESFAIFLQPVAFRQLLGIPGNHLVDRSSQARDVLGVAVEAIWSELAEASSFAERVRLAERFLVRIPLVAEVTLIERTAMASFRGGGRIGVNHVAGGVSLSMRQFERRFEREIGMPPKLFGRISRFQSALDAKVTAPTRTWLDVSQTLGYYDQMHLVRDFKDLGGINPTGLMSQLRDARPPALADSASLLD